MNVIRTVLLLSAIFISSCSSQPKMEYTPFTGVQRGTPINVVAFEGVTSEELKTVSIGEYLLTGAGMGMAVGAETGFMAGLELTDDCGEFLIVCLGLMPVFGMAGMVMGTIVGGVVGLVEDLPESTVNSMKGIINQYFNQKPINERLVERFSEKASPKWEVNDSAQTSVVLAVIGIRAINDTGDDVAFEFTIAMSVDYSGTKISSTKPFHVTHITRAYEIDDWVAGGNDLFAIEMNHMMSKSSDVFVKLLDNKI